MSLCHTLQDTRDLTLVCIIYLHTCAGAEGTSIIWQRMTLATGQNPETTPRSRPDHTQIMPRSQRSRVGSDLLPCNGPSNLPWS